MSAKRRIHLFLMHLETGQRYPVSEQDLVIGRSSGDILFPDDNKLSAQHCRIVKTPAGLAIHDLGSHNGTVVDGHPLEHGKMYLFKAGSTVTVGHQSLRLLEPSFAKRANGTTARKRKRRRKKKGGFDAMTFGAGLILAVTFVMFMHNLMNLPKTRTAPSSPQDLETPYEMVEKDVRAVFDEYTRLGGEHQAGRLSDNDLAYQIRRNLVPGFTSAHTKLSVLKPISEWERRKLDVHRKLVGALLAQVTAYAEYLETKDPKHQAAVDKHTKSVDALNAELLKFKEPRRPAAGSAPSSY